MPESESIARSIRRAASFAIGSSSERSSDAGHHPCIESMNQGLLVMPADDHIAGQQQPDLRFDGEGTVGQLGPEAE